MPGRVETGSSTTELEQRNHELSILNVVAQALNRESDLKRSLETVLAYVAELLDLQTGWIWLLAEDGQDSYLAASQNLPPGLSQDPHRMEGTCYCLDGYRSDSLDAAAKIPVMICSRLNQLVDGTDGLRYHATIPLYAHGKKLGILNVASADWREPSADDLRLLHIIGDLLSIAIERARLFEQSVRLGVIEERNRLAREIHDTLAQGLTAITLQLETADVLLETGKDPGRAHQAVQQALSLTRANLEEARRSVLDLRAAILEGRTLAEGLAALAAECASASGLNIAFDAAGAGHPLSLRVEAGLYRVAQEALTNLQRHAGASHARLELVVTPDHANLAVEDDGRGFDPQQVPKGRYGLIGMRERVKLLGGSLDLRSSPGAGTRLSVNIPLETRP